MNKIEKGQNRHWKNFVDKDYIGSHNLEEGEEMLLTITKFEGEEPVTGSDGSKQVKPVLYFEEDVPKMIMNMTNGNVVSSLYGTHPEKWIGRQIQIYVGKVKAFGKLQDALRVRDFVPKIIVDIELHTQKLMEAKDLNQLKDIWSKFPVSVRNDKEMITRKDSLKTKLQ